ncbi:MAG TPA: endo alpha-1,4 polygalactosaminidase [Candidatus Hydrogenedentes bacterium]|nr:endo alpha-1,4 polygalactosaminidase [Candidatus Hydrogenedentota bacterium]HPG66841.1 endo alpha-1,4 polygalactosaminidase [Candidatus Hydrogenedentota bacterium]
MMRGVLAAFLGAILVLTVSGCPEPEVPQVEPRDFRQDMREFVQRIGQYAKARKADTIVIAQNGQDLLTTDGKAEGPWATVYADALDGIGREDVYYGFYGDNVATPKEERDNLLAFLDRAEANGVEALVTDYCRSLDKILLSYSECHKRGFISFQADHRELDNVPAYPPVAFNVNSHNVDSLADACNFLYLINPGEFPSKEAYLETLGDARHDLLIIDLFYEDEALSAQDVAGLRVKPQGGDRLVIAYLSIGEAEEYRYYWGVGWKPGNPGWVVAENPEWDGNYIVKYWDEAWQALILGDANAYLDRILAAGFDGIYLDIIDAFEYFEAIDYVEDDE